MKETTKIVYEAWDGTPHETRDKCLAYERATQWRRLIGLTEEQVHAAMKGDDEDIAQAIITIGYRCAAVRKALARKAAKTAPQPGDDGHPWAAEAAPPAEPSDATEEAA